MDTECLDGRSKSLGLIHRNDRTILREVMGDILIIAVRYPPWQSAMPSQLGLRVEVGLFRVTFASSGRHTVDFWCGCCW